VLGYLIGSGRGIGIDTAQKETLMATTMVPKVRIANVYDNSGQIGGSTASPGPNPSDPTDLQADVLVTGTLLGAVLVPVGTSVLIPVSDFVSMAAQTTQSGAKTIAPANLQGEK
jgi:hypothetical protein